MHPQSVFTAKVNTERLTKTVLPSKRKKIIEITAFQNISIWEARKIHKRAQNSNSQPPQPTKEHFPPLREVTQRQIVALKTTGGQERPAVNQAALITHTKMLWQAQSKTLDLP